MATNDKNAGGSGRLIVNVRTANSAFPVFGATVTVENEGGTPFRQRMTTDISGNTAPISLAAPAAANSLAPNEENPYATYRITVMQTGFYPHENREVPVFDGITSVQGVKLIPLAPYARSETYPRGNIDFSSGQTLTEGDM